MGKNKSVKTNKMLKAKCGLRVSLEYLGASEIGKFIITQKLFHVPLQGTQKDGGSDRRTESAPLVAMV